MKRKATLAIQDLCACDGCEVALADMGHVLLDLLDDKVDLVYAPLFMSARDYGEVDILMLTGVVRTEDDIADLRQARQRARYIVAFGSCAVFGGIPGLANLHEQATLLETVYRNAPFLRTGEGTIPTELLPALTGEILPIDAYVDVDFSLPGCPPPPRLLADFLERVLKQVTLQEKCS